MKTELTIKNDSSNLNQLKENAIAFLETSNGVKFYFASMEEAKKELKKLSVSLGNNKGAWFCIPQIGEIETYTWRKIKESDVEKSDFLQKVYR